MTPIVCAAHAPLILSRSSDVVSVNDSCANPNVVKYKNTLNNNILCILFNLNNVLNLISLSDNYRNRMDCGVFRIGSVAKDGKPEKLEPKGWCAS